MTNHYENLNFMAHLRDDGFVSRRLLRKFARMGMFYQRIRRYYGRYRKTPVLRIGDNRLFKQIRTLYSVFDLSCNAKFLLTIVNEIMLCKKTLTYNEIVGISNKFRIIVYRLQSVKYLFGWKTVRFALFCDNQCVIMELGDFGYEIIGYYIKASSFMSIDCIPQKNLPEYRKFSNFL